MISWSNKLAVLPCFTGIVCDIPQVNKEFVMRIPFFLFTQLNILVYPSVS